MALDASQLIALNEFDVSFDREAIEATWLEIVDRRISDIANCPKDEVFIRAALILYSRSRVVRLTVDKIVKKAGFSRSSFFRMHSFPEFQLKLYRKLCRLAILEYQDLINKKPLSPTEFAELTLSVLYSSHVAIRDHVFEQLVSSHQGCGFDEFNTEVAFVSDVIVAYCNKYSHLGYRRLSRSQVESTIRLFDFDIFQSRTSKTGDFPNAEQAFRLYLMFLGLIKK